MKTRLALCMVLCLLLAASILPAAAQGDGLEANITAGCVENFDPDTNYFPDQIMFEYAEGVEVEYFNNYKVVTVTQPWDGATEADAFQYVLVQCGTPAPDDIAEGAQVMQVPADTVMTMSTTHIPHLATLGVLDRLIGIDSILYIYNPEVNAMYEAGELTEIGSGPQVNVEVILDAEPDFVMTYGLGLSDWDTHPVLEESGIPFAMNSEHAENSPLARAEWIKFTALFFNQEAAANAAFDEVVTNYEALVALTADIPEEEKPVVLPNTFSTWTEAWHIPGGNTYVGQLIHDAGGAMIFGDDETVAEADYSVPMDFEVVYENGLDADIWLTVIFGVYSLDDLLAADSRYADFAPVETGKVFNDNARVNTNGGNDYWESGVTRPDLLLADLVAILYPDLLPDHELMYYLPLLPAS